MQDSGGRSLGWVPGPVDCRICCCLVTALKAGVGASVGGLPIGCGDDNDGHGTPVKVFQLIKSLLLDAFMSSFAWMVRLYLLWHIGAKVKSATTL